MKEKKNKKEIHLSDIYLYFKDLTLSNKNVFEKLLPILIPIIYVYNLEHKMI